MRVPIRLMWRSVAITKADGRLTAIDKKEDTKMNTNTTNDTLNDLDALIDYTTKLAIAIAPYGDGVGLAADHPLRTLKTLHREMTAAIATERRKRAADPRYNDGRMVARPNARDDRYNDSQPRKTDDPLDEHMGHGARSEPFDGGDLVKRSFEDALQARADRLALEKGITPEKAYVALLAQHQSVHKGFVRDRDPGATASPAQQRAWDHIEAAAESLVQKSSKPLSREAAIDKVLKSRLDLSRAYYGVVDPLGDRVR